MSNHPKQIKKNNVVLYPPVSQNCRTDSFNLLLIEETSSYLTNFYYQVFVGGRQVILVLISLLIFATGFVCPGQVFSQTYNSRHIGIHDGLPSNNVRDLIRDSRGFYWIATDAGLVKWYGNNFEIYSTQQGLPSPSISGMIEDGEGNLWLSLQSEGIVKFDGKAFETIIPLDSLPGRRIVRLKYSAIHDMIFIATDNGFVVYQNHEFRKLFPEPQTDSPPNVIVYDFIETGTFVYVLSHNNGLSRYYPGTGLLDYPDPADPGLMNTISGTITEEGDTIWGLSFQHIYFDGKEKQELITGIAEVFDYAEDLNGNVLIAACSGPFNSNGGIFRLGRNGIESLNNLYGIEADRINRVIYDPDERLIVISDLNSGIFILYPELIKNHHEGDIDPDNISIKSFATTGDGSLWLAGEKNIFVKRPGKESFDNFDIDILKHEFRRFMKEEFPLKYRYYLDPDGSYKKYQILNENNEYPYINPYIMVKNNDSIIFEDRVFYSPDEYKYLENIEIDNIKNLATGPDGNLWINTNTGFFKLTGNKVALYINSFSTGSEHLVVPEENTIIKYGHISIKIHSLKNEESLVHHIYPPSPVSLSGHLLTPEGLWIICRHRGLCRIQGKRVRHMNAENEDFNLNVTAITADTRGNMITGTNDGILQIIRYENDSINILHTLGQADKIRGRQIIWLETDNNGFLWAGTNLGVNRIDLNRLYEDQTLTVRFFDDEEGLKQPAVSSSFTDSSGNIWLGAPGMLAGINTGSFTEYETAPRNVFIRQIDLNYIPTSWEEIAAVERWTNIPVSGINLKHDNNNLSFYFSTTNIAGNDKTVFRQRIVGLNDIWSPFDGNRQPIYPNLPPGKYTLQVEAQVAGDESSRGITEFAFRILQPWWQTWWFYTLSGISLIAGFWIILIMRVKHIRKTEVSKLNQEREISELRIKALQAQMNPHFTFNAINSIQYFLINNDKNSAFQFIGHFSRLIRQTLESAFSSSVSVKEEISFVENYINLEQMRFENKFSYDIKIDPILDSHQYQIPPMLLQPFVENAILHGLLHKDEKGMIKIHFEVSGENALKCTLEDDGVGREKSAEINRGRHKNHKSVGLEITRRRVGLLNQPRQKDYHIKITDLYDEYNKPRGTRVVLIIPRDNSNMLDDGGDRD